MNNGYAGNVLGVDLSSGDIRRIPTATYAERFLGGKGIAAKIYWDGVSPKVKAFDPENHLIFITGPVCGVPGFAGSRWLVCGKSPIGNTFSYCNLGGSWGAHLKLAGFDGLFVHGKSDAPVYLYVQDDKVEIRDAGFLKGKGAITAREMLKKKLGKSFRIVAVGPAGENMVNFATLLADGDSSGSGGFGAVMGSKNLKAIAVKGTGKVQLNKPDEVKTLRKRIKELKSPEIDLLIEQPEVPAEKLKKDICFGCINGCDRVNYIAANGKKGKFFCGSSMISSIFSKSDSGISEDVPFTVNKLFDDYGVDVFAVLAMVMWLDKCNQEKILDEEKTGLPLANIWSFEFIEQFLKKLCFRKGFGDVLAQGTYEASKIVGKGSEQLHLDYMFKSGQFSLWSPRLYITNGLLYAMEPRVPVSQAHEIVFQVRLWAGGINNQYKTYMTSEVMRAIGKRYWGSEIAADFSTYEGKALAAAKIQDRQYVRESLILCDYSWGFIHSHATADHVGDPTLESHICRTITGRDVDESELNRIGERIFNLQRAILVREGSKGRESDVLEEMEYSVPLQSDPSNPECIVPGKDGEAFSRNGMVIDRDEFEKMKDEYYELRGWDHETGLQKADQLEQLGLADVAQDMRERGMLS